MTFNEAVEWLDEHAYGDLLFGIQDRSFRKAIVHDALVDDLIDEQVSKNFPKNVPENKKTIFFKSRKEYMKNELTNLISQGE